MASFDLVVIAPFWGYNIGDTITTDEKVENVLRSHAREVVRVNRPSPPAKPKVEDTKPSKGA